MFFVLRSAFSIAHDDKEDDGLIKEFKQLKIPNNGPYNYYQLIKDVKLFISLARLEVVKHISLVNFLNNIKKT
jgi:type III secretion system FlhB-like substrate exporter